MKTIETSLLLYSLCFAVFLAATAALQTQNTNPAFVILMLPLVGYFLMELKRATKSRSESAFSAKKLLGFLIILLILIAVAASSFSYNQKATNVKTQTQDSPIIVSSNDSKQVVIGKVEIINEKDSPVNVYKEKDDSSEILFSANIGDVFSYTEHAEGWITILYEDDKSGHINEIYTATIIQ